ncbi:MAG: hypothetical protein NTY96_08745 [Bacteroidetes bacterium]|nr:hypothetical protein [Bacteroidota bacterium]
MKIFFTAFFVLVLATVLSANNVTVSNLTLTGKNTTDQYILVQFDISWENSFRVSTGPANWDAAWVFVKYRVPVASGGDGLWKHTWLNNTGHTAPSGSTLDIGLLTPSTAFDATTNPGLGAFIYRSTDGVGSFTKTGVQLRWNYGANGLADDANTEIQIYALEMIYIPQGSFYLGSGGSETGAFYKYPTTTNPFQVTSEGQITVGSATNNLFYSSNGDWAGPVPAAFPKGYNAFYSMKYEISQQGYVDFLNNLTQTQANTRKYTYTGERYAITGSTVATYTTTNPYVACNYLSWADLAAYLDWSGLRPMTELEFEKACRGTLTSVVNEYAWGTTGIAGSAYTLNNSSANNEVIATNFSTVNGNTLYNITSISVVGPVRVGIFAGTSGNTGRVTAGSTYYGMLEMSGNLWERPISIGNNKGRSFSGIHGNGLLDLSGNADVTAWPGTDAIGASFRGGNWGNNVGSLRVSDRRDGASVVDYRNSDYGGRGVRSFPTLPTVTTTAVSAITTSTASSGGNVTGDGGLNVTARGVCWSTSPNPTTANNSTSNGSGLGIFTSSLTGLSLNTLYYVRSYATNSLGTAYGNEVSFTTLANPPTVTTTIITNLAQTTATSGGNVTADGGASVTDRGVCWNTSSGPTTANSHTSDGAGTGSFTSSLTSLSANTLYYARAYAVNSAGTAYGNEVIFTTLSSSNCGSFTISHVTSGGVAPVNKTVTYGTVTNIPGETSKCWITQNLGADHQATTVNDATEASGGWYWQFNRKQGYKHDGTTLTPSWTITSISENLNWQAVNDPCTLELGGSWRLPTYTEWANVDASGGWTDWNGPYNSGLKLHATGYLDSGTGMLIGRGIYGHNWSSTQAVATTAFNLTFNSTQSYAESMSGKANGFGVRCIK